jgi:hypothetical protein
MKIIGITSTAFLCLLLALVAPANAQQERQGEKQDHPQQQQSKQKQTKQKQAKQEQTKQKQAKQEQAKPAQQHAQQQRQSEQKQQQPQRAQQQQQNQNKQSQQRAQRQQRQDQNKQTQQRAQQQQRGNQRPQRTQEQQRVQQSAWQQHRSQHWDSDHRSWQQRGGYHGYRIPDDRFRGYFGPEHGFRIYGLPFLVVGGYPRFQYNGFWFSMVDPWPEYWANDWYDTDDVYVTYVDNGYYLFNRRYPNVGIAISISR